MGKTTVSGQIGTKLFAPRAPADPGLQEVIKIWPDLSAEVKIGIPALATRAGATGALDQ